MPWNYRMIAGELSIYCRRNCQLIVEDVPYCHTNVTFCDIPCDTAYNLGIINTMRGQKQECRFERMVTA